ncbi:MAG TPA: ATP synthase F1 subunit gamma [Verrucomicrobiales bacterium]|nr:ATP synthase F1 subunit gamma [Verrucomicrobiales bacterium]
MPNTRDIRRRIKSVKNTAQITKAMQLVAASKMKRAQDQALSGRHYADLLNKVLVNLKEYSLDETHDLLEARGEGREIVVVVSADKGLCGALNTNLLRRVVRESGENAGYVTIGAKGRRTLGRLRRDLLADFSVADPVDFVAVKMVSKFVRERFLAGECTRVRVAFTNFINTLQQAPYFETLLPVSPVALGARREFEGIGTAEEGTGKETVPDSGYIFEPSPQKVFDQVVPQYIDFLLYQMVLEARASEHSARMVAMKSATDNANQLIKDLTLEYNKVRQASITAELLEISTAQMALG